MVACQSTGQTSSIYGMVSGSAIWLSLADLAGRLFLCRVRETVPRRLMRGDDGTRQTGPRRQWQDWTGLDSVGWELDSGRELVGGPAEMQSSAAAAAARAARPVFRVSCLAAPPSVSICCLSVRSLLRSCRVVSLTAALAPYRIRCPAPSCS